MMAKKITEPNKINFRDLFAALLSAYRAGEVRITNYRNADVDEAITEIEAAQKRHTRANADKTYHLMLSFPQHERPLSSAELRKIEDHFCAKLGYAEHQRASVAHHDIDDMHLHIVISKIHPQKFTIWEPYYDYKKLSEAGKEVEKLYNLRKTNHDKVIITRLRQWIKDICAVWFRRKVAGLSA
jgi:hypothetical protein